MSKGKKIFLSVGVIAVVIVAIVLISNLTEKKNYRAKYEGTDLGLGQVELGREDTYAIYLNNHKTAARPSVKEIAVDVTDYVKDTALETEVKTNFEGTASVLYQDDKGYTEWKVNIPEAGMYRVYMEYYPVASRGVNIERAFLINGEVPFNGTDALTFTRRWKNRDAVITDNQGNDRKPVQVETPDWCSTYFRDYMGYYSDPYEYYFEKGENTIALQYVNEPIAIRKLTIQSVTKNQTYAEYRASQPDVTGDTRYSKTVQGEDSTVRSAQSLYARSDHSSPNTVPYSVTSEKLNYIGSNAWRIPGQWIEWDIEVPSDGYYNITVKARQNVTRGAVSSRTVYIDGEIPFEEMKAVAFPFSNDWMNVTLADKDGKAYEFYLTAGTHTLRMEVCLGDSGEILSNLQDSIVRMNEMYRRILALTGTNPDRYRDYHLERVFPDVIEAMSLEYKRLYKAVDDYVAYSGEIPSTIATIASMARRLEKFSKKPEKIAQEFTAFKTDISSVGTSVNSLSEAPLDIDYITVTGTDVKPEKVNNSIFAKIGHEVRSFIASFTVDYDNLGDVHSSEDAITVWVCSGRDQANVLKALIDDEFTPNTGIYVNLKLVQTGIVLNATIGGNGPDIAVTMNQGDAVNYALRNAVVDLTQFDDYKDVISQYADSAMAPYWFEGGLYGIPQTQIYNVLFYRQDILDKIGVEIPKTWNDLIDMLPTLQQQNLQVAIPSTERKIGADAITATPDLSAFVALLYQNGGTMYNQNNTKTLIASEAGVKAFEIYTRFYTHYGLSLAYDFTTRFRSGEMPIGVQDYDTYNTLALAAPEIRGRWGFALMPGTMQEDGTIDRSCSSWGQCTMMLKKSDRSEEKTQKCWEFFKWWVDAPTQTQFGQEIEAVLGQAARYSTANLISFESLTWNADQMDVLRTQRSFAVEVPEVAGGYFITRHITNAARRVFNYHEDPRETLLDYADTINDEIEKKRKEYGLTIE